MTPNEYFVQAQYLGSRIVEPSGFDQPFGVLTTDADRVRDDFLAANPAMSAGAIALRCERGWLSEVRFCVTKDFGYRECPMPVVSNCRSGFKIRGVDRRLRIARSE